MTEYTVLGVNNSTNEDLNFTWDKVPYVAKANKVTNLPKFLAEYAALKLARLIVTEKFGFGKVNDTKIMDETIKSILIDNPDYVIAKPKTEKEKLEAEIKAMNPVVEDNSPAEVIEDSFSSLNDSKIVQESEEDMRIKELKSNNPKAAYAEELQKLAFPKLRVVATQNGISSTGMKAAQIIEAILEKKFA